MMSFWRDDQDDWILFKRAWTWFERAQLEIPSPVSDAVHVVNFAQTSVGFCQRKVGNKSLPM